MNEITLDGCTPTPLVGYLKALGVLRLLSAKYPDTRGFWRGDRFVLHTSLDRDGITQFFLEDYEPTPIMAPWNGGSGFFEKDNKTALTAVENSTSRRFEAYRASLAIAEASLAGMDRSASPKDADKTKLLTRIRGALPDKALSWFDASVLLSNDKAQFPPLLGTGGNDGRLDFTNNFMQRLLDVLGSDENGPPDASIRWLDASLFAESTPGLSKNAIGQFSPGQAGGPNATTGFDTDAVINPWDFVLMIEGAQLFAAAAVRRNADDPSGVLSYPFTVRAIGAGSGSLGEGDAADARGELWMPLWTQAATSLEIQALMAEGRIAFGKKPAKDALDFVRAVQHLGGYRGVQSFQRFGLLKRSGKAYLATPLSRITIDDKPRSRWLDDLDRHSWLQRFQRFANDANTATRFKVLRTRVEDALFVLSGRDPSKAEAQALLALLGEIQSALSSSKKALENARPIPRLSERWVQAADDGSAAFRIAKALAGLHGVGDQPLPLRAQLFPLHRRFDQWMTPDAGEKVRIYTGRQGYLVDTLSHLLARRLWLAKRLEMHDKPLDSLAGATLEDLAAFLNDDGMDARIAALLPGLVLCNIPRDVDRTVGDGVVPPAFGLLKLSMTPDRTLHALQRLPKDRRLPVATEMLAQLAAGNHGNRAVKTAWRRLYASGLAPLFTANALPSAASIHPQRACAALLIPLRYGASAALARALLQPTSSMTEVI